MDVEIPSALSDRAADESCNDINSPDINSFSCDTKRVRFASPCQIPNLVLSTPPYSSDGDGKRSITDPENSDSDESRDGTISPQRQRRSAFQDVETALNGRNGQLERSPAVISGDDEFDGLGNLSDDNNPSSASLSAPAASDSALGASRICPQFVDINQEWEYRKIIGEELVDGVSCYEIEWCSSLIPKASVKHRELVAEYEARRARARARREPKGKRGVQPDLKHCSRVTGDANTMGGHPQKRPRGRPRKIQPATVC